MQCSVLIIATYMLHGQIKWSQVEIGSKILFFVEWLSYPFLIYIYNPELGELKQTINWKKYIELYNRLFNTLISC